MSRCEHCECRNSWDCEDEYYRVSNDNTCDNFKLDFNTLTDKQKKKPYNIFLWEKKIGGIIMNSKQINENIKVGDEVIVQVDRIGFVTGFDVLFDRIYVTTKEGWSDAFGRSFVKKTGRHFDEIENVLKQMRKGNK